MSAVSFRSWIRTPAHRDPALAIALAVVVLLATSSQGYTTVDAAGLAALCLPLSVRTQWPLAVLGTVALGSVIYLALARSTPAFILPTVVALYTVGVRGSRRRALLVAASLLPGVVFVVLVFRPEDGVALPQILEELSQTGFALAVGEAIRSRREYAQAVLDREQREAHARELEAHRWIDEERVRIARDVHDVVAHSIATISTQASVGVHVASRDPERALEALRAIKLVSNRALHDLRHALGALRDPADDGSMPPTPSMQGVAELIEQARATGLPVELRMQGAHTEMPAALQVAIYRIIQEGLTNVMRHAGGARATVEVAVAAGEVAVEIGNDGSGAPTPDSEVGTRSGLAGMSERASALGGSLEAVAQPGGGFRVRAVMPVALEAAE